MEPFEVFAIRYGHLGNRHPGQSYILADPHEYGPDLDYYVWVARRSDCMFVVDTGFSQAAAVRRKREHLRSPVDALRLLDIDPEKVTDVILTHLHYDHAGNLDRFPAARYHVQDREVSYATGRCMCHPFLREAYDLENALEMVRRIYSGRAVFHDGESGLAPGLTLHRVGGHTAGLQILRIWTARGWVVLAADAAHLYTNFENNRPFPVAYSVAEMLEGYKLLFRLAETSQHIVPGHDPLVMKYYAAPRPDLDGIVVRLDVPPSR
jgi:glyoxylase-like metal-dependent hydrolase (beta-lactamase superfamily II)